jgi:hypothetical protein
MYNLIVPIVIGLGLLFLNKEERKKPNEVISNESPNLSRDTSGGEPGTSDPVNYRGSVNNAVDENDPNSSGGDGSNPLGGEHEPDNKANSEGVTE